MITYTDENVGIKVPKALKLVGLRTIPAISKGGVGEPDIQWLERVGKKGWLGVSCNKNMLNVPEERDAIINNNVGIVFFNSGNLHPRELLYLILRKLAWMEGIDANVVRPFAFLLYNNGLVKKVL